MTPAERLLEVRHDLAIPLREVGITAARSGGPGGQNVNKVASKVVLRFSVRESPSLSDAQRRRLLERLGHRLTREGELVLSVSTHRERRRNQEEGLERLARVLRSALAVQRPRKPTRPTRASVRRRVETKRRRGQRKEERRRGGEEP